jgi:hypothetical protein
MPAQKYHHSSRRVVRNPLHATPSSRVFAYQPPTLTAEDRLTSSAVPRDVTHVRVHGSEKAIQPRAFQDCSDLVEVEPGVWNSPSIIRVEIPSSVTTIGDLAFDGCTLLEEVDFSDDYFNHNRGIRAVSKKH